MDIVATPAKRTKMTPAAFLLAGFFMISSAQASIIYDSGLLFFESSGQSMWDTGTAFQASDSVFLGAQWTNRTATIGGIAGSANQVVIPAIDAITVPVYEPSVWVPTPTWSDPFGGYYIGCGCWKDVQVTPAIDAITADTRTGAELNVHTSGKVGLEFGYSIDSGSIDTIANFQATAALPDVVNASEFFDISTNSIFDNGSLDTQSPKIEAYISAIMQLSGSIDAQACALTFGCASSGSIALPTVNLDQRILSVDPNSVKLLDGVMPDGNAFAEVPLLNQSLKLEGGATIAPPVVGFKLEGPGGVTLASSLPPTPAVTMGLAEMTFYAPDIATTGTGSGNNVTSSGRDDLLSAQLDIDGAATLLAGMPPAGLGFDLIDAGPFKLSASLDLIDVKAGPVLGIAQDFEFTPTLMTNIEFSNPVQIDGLAGLHNSWTGLWNDLPSFALTGTTTFTPTFWLDALLTNDMALDLGLIGTLDVLKLGATGIIAGIDVLNFNAISLNQLLGLDNTLFETPKVEFSIFGSSFDLAGFNTIAGTPFTLSIAEASVPEPGTLILLLLGLMLLLLARSRRLAMARTGKSQ